ncbi:MAG: WD40/YVTN/BNR-like repeat-containing protein [Pyrinomonadaceae bacterium]
MNQLARFFLILLLIIVTAQFAFSQYDPETFAAMQWRLVGPHRAGRVTTVAGIPGNAAIYYFGTPGGGVWKTVDGGRVWTPIFDATHVASIGALALAPSNPDIIYVGTGEETAGNGLYKSTDAGKTWNHIGLNDTRYISGIIVDPKDPNTVLVSARDYLISGPGRGIFKTRDGGKTWKKVFFKDDHTSVVDLEVAPDDPHTIFAATYNLQIDPANRRALGAESLIFKSTDAGDTWQQVSSAGLPNTARGTIGLAIAPKTSARRVYAILNNGFFRSDDGGGTWQRSTNDPRITGSTYFGKTYVDPVNPDLIYVMQTSTYRSLDGGKNWESYKGAPSGEDQHVLWIDPQNPQRIFLGSDQGAIISLDGGHTWSDWFTQPTGQFYHVTTDNQFPYRLYAAQQDSGSVAVLSRSDFGMITYRDWFSAGAFESGYISPDPTNPNIIFSVGWYGSVFRLDRTTGQIATVFAPGAKYRYTWETPLVRSPHDAKTMYLGTQFLMRTTDNGETWSEISPDLTARSPAEKSVGVIEAISPSAALAGEIWVGSSTGIVEMTRDNGATWANVTPGVLPPHAGVTRIEASVRDANTAYLIASVPADLHPYIFRTRDAGKSWQKIVDGLPNDAIARAIREDGQRPGLLYGGTENGVYVSFDGGDHWQTLQFNLPTTSVRDLDVHGSDLVAATYGRGLWILDDISPLRQVDLTAATALLKPAEATRVRFDNHPDTPLSIDLPHGDNPPEGAIIYYYLKAPARQITLEVRDKDGNAVRRFSSKPSPSDNRPANVPDYWFAPPDVMTTNAGLNRFAWNLEWEHPDALTYNFRGRHIDYIEYTLPDHAVPGRTPRYQPPGPLAVPGTYEVILTVDGKSFRQPLTIKLDPRVHVNGGDLEAQLEAARMIDDWMNISYRAYNDVNKLRATLDELRKAQKPELSELFIALDKELDQLQEGTAEAPGFGAVNRDVTRFVTMIQSADGRAAKSIIENVAPSCTALKNDLMQWRKINQERLPALNGNLKQTRLSLPVAAVPNDPRCPNL